jgi:hypothetical protein
MRASLVFVLLAGGSNALVAGCSNQPVPSGAGTPVASNAGASGEAVAVTRQAIGEQQNGFPSPWERATFMAANRARSDPATVKGAASTVFPAVKPLVLEYPLEQSSRFHAVNLDDAGVTLMHTSPCTLNTDVATSGCTGAVSCACATPVPAMCAGCASDAGPTNMCGTQAFTRIRYFYPAGNAEVAAAGYRDPWSLMDGWVDEAAGADGHRRIIDSVESTGLGASDESVAGFGHAGGPVGCFQGMFDVGDFGPTTTAPPTIASAAPNPISATAAATFTIYATWADPGGAPADINAVVDGTCTPMTLELGTPTLNATYMAAVPLTAGCHSVFIVGDTSTGTRATYPTTTAFTIPVAAAAGSCADELPQPATACPGVDGGVGGADASFDSGAGSGDGGAVSPGSEGGVGLGDEAGSVGADGGTPDAGLAGGGLDGGGDSAAVSDGGTDASSSSGCACGVAPSSGATGAWAALAACGLVVPLRRRRRSRNGL